MAPRFTAILLVPMIATGVHAQDSDAMKARGVIGAAIAAKGGKEKLAELPAWHIKYRESWFRDGKEMIEVGDAYENLSLNQARYGTAPDDFILVNGKEGWIKKGEKVTVLTAGQLADFHEYFGGKAAMLTLLPLQSDDWQSSVVGEKEIDGRATIMLRIARKKWTGTLYLDKKTRLVAGAEYPHKRLIEIDDSKRIASMREAKFSDYKAVEGIQFHTKLASFAKGKELGKVEITTIKLMKQLPDGVLVAPK